VKTAVFVNRRRILAIFATVGVFLAGGACGSEDETAIVFDADLETGNISQWNGAQCKNTGTPDGTPPNFVRGNVTVVSDVKASGSYAGRFDLPLHTAQNACEVLHTRPLGSGASSWPAPEEWYAQEFRLPTNWQPEMSGYFNSGSTTGGGLAISQYAYQGFGPGMALEVNGDSTANTTKIRLPLNFGPCQDPPVGCRGDGRNLANVLVDNPVELGVWYQILIRIKRTPNHDGYVEAWVRKRGETTWVQKVSYTGVTVQWWEGTPPRTSWRANDKVGGYRGGGSAAMSIWHDNFCVATTRAAAESCF
jgi:Polysaccharide lyase